MENLTFCTVDKLMAPNHDGQSWPFGYSLRMNFPPRSKNVRDCSQILLFILGEYKCINYFIFHSKLSENLAPAF